LVARANEKLAARYYGPFEIEKEVGPVTYQLKLPPHCQIHPTFHVSQLWEAKGAMKATMELPKQLNEDLEMVVEPSVVLGVRSGDGRNMRGAEVLIQWKGLPPLEATWEPYSAIQQQFPFFHRFTRHTKGVQGIGDSLGIRLVVVTASQVGEGWNRNYKVV